MFVPHIEAEGLLLLAFLILAIADLNSETRYLELCKETMHQAS